MEEKSKLKDYIGCGLSSLIGLTIFAAFSMLMFWLCMKCTGYHI